LNPVSGNSASRGGARHWPARPRAPRVSTGSSARRAASLLSDSQWSRVAPVLVPAEPADERAARRARGALEGALWVLKSGAPWSALPARYPTAAACRRQWRAWMRDGRWLDLWRAYVATLGPQGRLEWSRAFVRAGERLERGPRGGAAGTPRYAWWLVSARVFLWEAPWTGRDPRAARPRPAIRRSGSVTRSGEGPSPRRS
jgi:transposase